MGKGKGKGKGKTRPRGGAQTHGSLDMTMRTALMVGLVALAGGCARAQGGLPGPTPAADTAGIAAQLMAADRAFNDAAAARGLDGWMSFFAPEAVSLNRMAEPARGEAAVRARSAATFANPAVRLTWGPIDAGAFLDGRSGWTVGRYEIRRRAADGAETVAGTGRYITLWRRAEGNRWLITLDTGAPDPRP